MAAVSVVRGVADNGKAMEWMKMKTLSIGSYGFVDLIKLINSDSDRQVLVLKYCRYKLSNPLRNERHILRQFDGCSKIVQCYGVVLSFEKGMYFYNLLLEYAPDGTLSDLIKKYGGSVPESDVKWYTKMLLEGIRCIHAKGYVHCDIKPNNILVFPSADRNRCDCNLILKIADFGMVKQPGEKYYSKIKIPGKVKYPGTSSYMPPEEKISSKLDVWSLGCTVLEMITGKQPWEHAKNETDLAMQIVFSRCPPNKIPETLSREGKDFLIKCLASDPRERWSVDMLLNHPFVASDSTKSIDCVPSMEELEARICLELGL